MKAFACLLAGLLLLSSTSLAQTAPAQATTPSSSPTLAAAVSIAPVFGRSFGRGAKLFLEPMDGFGKLLSEAILKKKVPVVLVQERAKADFVLSGEAHVKKRGFVAGFVLSTHGGGNISITDARTGNQVFACTFHRVNQGVAEYYIYQGWANGCAKHLKKALKKK